MKKAKFKLLSLRRFASAENDLKSARVILKEGGYYGTTCFLSQQIAEKYLKGFLIFHGKDPQKIHSLLVLLKRCVQIDPELKTIEKACRGLDKYYIEPRYADYPIDYPKEEAAKALNDTLLVRNLIKKKVNV